MSSAAYCSPLLPCAAAGISYSLERRAKRQAALYAVNLEIAGSLEGRRCHRPVAVTTLGCDARANHIYVCQGMNVVSLSCTRAQMLAFIARASAAGGVPTLSEDVLVHPVDIKAAGSDASDDDAPDGAAGSAAALAGSRGASRPAAAPGAVAERAGVRAASAGDAQPWLPVDAVGTSVSKWRAKQIVATDADPVLMSRWIRQQEQAVLMSRWFREEEQAVKDRASSTAQPTPSRSRSADAL